MSVVAQIKNKSEDVVEDTVFDSRKTSTKSKGGKKSSKSKKTEVK